jgi:POT family proton-dependent oligopeptide transporter
MPSHGPRSHPRGLAALFMTEMWERFCYYGMRALLVLYLVQYVGMQPSQASVVYKWYTSLVYLTPIVGGVLADRVVGLRVAILTGGLLMAVGEFLLTVPSMASFYLGLGLLVAGNGFFKPNISTMVGKMYGPGDVRRDRAFTIFYMGINLGALAAPIVAGYLREHYGFRYGFAVAGVGLLVGLGTFLVSQRQILGDIEAAGNDLTLQTAERAGRQEQEAGAEGAAGVSGVLARAFPILMLFIAVAVPVRYVWLASQGAARWSDVLMPCAFAGISGWMGVTLLRLRGAARDKSTVIFVFFAFAVLFWMAFEQAGNALNLWAQFHTRLEVGPWHYPAEWWQSVNPVLIVLLAPVFARVWTWLGERGREPSTPAKMLVAMVMMTLSFGAMVAGAQVEDATETQQPLRDIPLQIPTRPGPDGTLVVGDGDAGRLTYDPDRGQLRARGALPAYVVGALLARTAPRGFAAQVESLEESTRGASRGAPVAVTLKEVPRGFALPFTAEEARDLGVSYDPPTQTLTFVRPLESPTRAAIVSAGAPPWWREPLQELARRSDAARVSGIWLFLSYLFATLGELCLSPVGLSMVTKLAPGQFASLFMGVWLLASSVAQYAGGSIGESWGIVPPAAYFRLFVWTSVVGAMALAFLVKPLKRLMHDVS